MFQADVSQFASSEVATLTQLEQAVEALMRAYVTLQHQYAQLEHQYVALSDSERGLRDKQRAIHATLTKTVARLKAIGQVSEHELNVSVVPAEQAPVVDVIDSPITATEEAL